jgi:hypothetical protein
VIELKSLDSANFRNGPRFGAVTCWTVVAAAARYADEINAVAMNLGAPSADIHLGRDASEATVKRAPLADYRIVYFATHGLVASDINGLAEPSLALTIPPQPSDLDDGLLTASEVAQLKLNADWVVLSACNTIAGDKPGAEALSGLARAFFYAGAHALLVSHWSVASDAAARLTTATFDILKADPTLGRAEAMRRGTPRRWRMEGRRFGAAVPANGRSPRVVRCLTERTPVGRSLDLLNQPARSPHQGTPMPAFLDRFTRIQSIL